MKIKQLILGLAIMVISNTISVAQNTPTLVAKGSIAIPKITEPCLSNSAREALESSIKNNIEYLHKSGKLQPINKKAAHPLFDWPVTQANGFNYNSIWIPYNYVDHDPDYPNRELDFYCGRRTYDTPQGYNHSGTDIVPWPFWWKQMERNQAVNIAAADGQIIVKQDGAFDRNCAFNNSQWNGIVLQHSDGSRSYYFHMKNGSVTTKEVGDWVTKGEYLGVIGSSGNSNVPHLHFEVKDSSGILIDPYEGACNPTANESWWSSQKPYLNPAVMAVLTHDDFPIFRDCPQVETTNEKNEFEIRVPYYLGVYIRDQRRNTSVELKVIRPDNSSFSQWIFPFSLNDVLSYYIFSGNSDMEGVWRFEATYEGNTAVHYYTVGQLGISENELTNTKIFPNPATSEVNILSDHTITKVTFIDLLGRIIFEKKADNGLKNINVSSLSKGLYFMTLTSIDQQSKTLKMIKE
ncbi:peptidoglycan DD-metalloendopeptidase family protein [Aequorivita sp. F47161]|uniref:Peptidoglycan DD-metalloendopeptidase family protein n=1 Tax=Aequorivita vitellina TaxID=2874475 RepID=A0A9X1U1W7_9FLAO|nr:peptidoglycan DD-metalloendopeptidase family protein [Aequorivita vitellina]MCG2419330.1 peptidoglycan DD-metalloendopeptidase family protein [Aequorivita vitellina]